MAITKEEVRQLALSLPNTEETGHWGKQSFRVNGKIYAVIQSDGVSVVVKTTRDEREALTTLEPDVFSMTPSFQRLNYMLVHMERIDRDSFRSILVRAWKLVAPKKVIKEFETK